MKPPSSSSGPNQYSTTAYISNGEDNAVNISITSNGNAHHDINKKATTAPQHNSNQSKNLHSANKRNTAQNNGANSSANIRGIYKLQLDLIPIKLYMKYKCYLHLDSRYIFSEGTRKGPHHPSPSPSRKPIQQTKNSNNAQATSSSPSKASNPHTKVNRIYI